MRNAQDDLELLLNNGMTLAEELLSQRGELSPFAVVLDAEAELRHVHVYDGHELPRGADLLERLTRTIAQEVEAAGLLAVGIFSATTLRDGTIEDAPVQDAVEVGLEHREGYAADVFFRYSTTPHGIAFEEPVAMRRKALCFA